MMKGNEITKRLAMIVAVAAIVIATVLNGQMTAAARKVQMMEIACPHCHGFVTINVLLDDQDCPQCHENIHIDG